MGWNGKKKALTFSYDDGILFDRRLVELFNRYGMKCTFNLNSGIQTAANVFRKEGAAGEVAISRMNMAELPALYAGHEVAVHSLTHPHLEALDEATVENELLQDKKNLEALFGTEVKGMAYPYGTYTDTVIRVAERVGLRYARTVAATHRFDVPAPGTLMTLPATCHHNDAQLTELGRAFLESDPAEPQLFYVWGHSYEFALNDNWAVIEDFCRMMAGRDDIFYGTNAEVLL